MPAPGRTLRLREVSCLEDNVVVDAVSGLGWNFKWQKKRACGSAWARLLLAEELRAGAEKVCYDVRHRHYSSQQHVRPDPNKASEGQQHGAV